MEPLMIRPAGPDDRDAVEALLRAAGLPTDGVADHLDTFFVVDDGGQIIGSAGLELYGEHALLRSVAIDPEARRSGLGSTLTRRALDEARARGAQAVYLLTTTAEEFFPRFGFRRSAGTEVPLPVRESREFQGACPASATVMRCELTSD
jgi:amino-acid N-acetyltransferase